MKIKLCLGSACFARGNREILNFLESEISAAPRFDLELSACLCQDECGSGPNVFIDEQRYEEMTLDKLRKILTLPNGEET